MFAWCWARSRRHLLPVGPRLQPLLCQRIPTSQAEGHPPVATHCDGELCSYLFGGCAVAVTCRLPMRAASMSWTTMSWTKTRVHFSKPRGIHQGRGIRLGSRRITPPILFAKSYLHFVSFPPKIILPEYGKSKLYSNHWESYSHRAIGQFKHILTLGANETGKLFMLLDLR